MRELPPRTTVAKVQRTSGQHPPKSEGRAHHRPTDHDIRRLNRTGHTPATIHIRLPYAHADDAGAPDESASYYTPHLVTQMPPRIQAGAISDEDESERSPTFGLGARNKRSQQEDIPGGHQRFRTMQRHSHRPNLRSFEDDGFNTQNPETTQNRINSALERLETLIDNATIENISQSTKHRIQALANRPNGNDISKTLRKITEVLENLTTQQENASNEPTLQKQTTATDLPRNGSLQRLPRAGKPSYAYQH